CPRTRLPLQLGDKCSLRGRWPARGGGGGGPAHVELGEAPVTPDVLAPAHDTVGERDARLATHKLAHFEAGGALADVEPAAITFGREEYLIVAALDHLGEVGVEPDNRAPALELGGAEILDPMPRALHAMEHALRAVGERHRGVLHGRRENAVDVDVAIEDAGKGCGVAGLAVDADEVGGEAVDAVAPVRRADHAVLRTRAADHTGHGHGLGNIRPPLWPGNAEDAGRGERCPAREAKYAVGPSRVAPHAGAAKRGANDALVVLRDPPYSGWRQRRAEDPGMEKGRNGNVIFDLAVNADVVDRRAGDTGVPARRAVHASIGRVRAKQACDGLAAAPHDATGEAISNHTPAVDGDSTRATESLVCKGVLGRKEVSTRKVSIVNRSHGSLLRMQIRAGTFSRIISRQGPLRWFSP